jgi:hypothetical protein
MRDKMRSVVVIVFLLALVANLSYANPYVTQINTLPFEGKVGDHTYKDKQYGNTVVKIGASGAITVTSTFSNGHKTDGDHFMAVTSFLGQDDKLLAVVSQIRGVNATLGGKTRVGSVVTNGQIPLSQVTSLKKITVAYGTEDRRPDIIILKAAAEILAAMANRENGFKLAQ